MAIVHPHARLLELAGAVALPTEPSTAELADVGRQLAGIAGTLAEGEPLGALIRRWSGSGAIAAEPDRFRASWALLLAAMRQLAAQPEERSAAELLPTPLRAPAPTGLPGVDHGHAKTLALIGGLRAAYGGGRDAIDAGTAADLAAIAEPHATEEDIMAVTRFPGRAEHRDEHRLARSVLTGFIRDHQAGRRVAVRQVLGFLEHWLAAHVAIVDQAMARHAATAIWAA